MKSVYPFERILGSPTAAPPQCEKRCDAEDEQPKRRRFRHRYGSPDAGAAVRLVSARIRHITRPDDGRRMPELRRVRRHGRVRQLSHSDVPQVRVWPGIATRRLRRGVIVMRVIRESARVHVMMRYAVRLQHAREKKRGDQGCQCTHRRCAFRKFVGAGDGVGVIGPRSAPRRSQLWSAAAMDYA